MKKLIHFGCSFAMGNGVPMYIKGIESGSYMHTTQKNRQEFKKKYNMEVQDPISCGSVLAGRLGLQFERVSANGISNEMIVRRLPQVKLTKTFVLIGLTSYNRREALTTSQNKTHWHTWKMVEPNDPPKYKTLPFNPWGKEYKPAIEEEGQIRTAMQILYMQSYLKLKKVPYLMFNALYNGFDNPLTDECKKILGKIDQTHFYKLQGGLSETQHGWCLKQNLVVSDLDEHPNMQGQQAWADQLEPLVKDIWNVD